MIENSGIVSVIGRPNTGKSTLINRICGEKVAIVTPKPQTTRLRLSAVFNRPPVQMVLIDTPGYHHPQTRLGERMNKASRDSTNGTDAVLVVAKPSADIEPMERELLNNLKYRFSPLYLAINKIDLIPKENLLPIIEAYKGLAEFKEIVPISARTGDGVEELVQMLMSEMPKSPAQYPEGITSDQSDRVLIAETIREKTLLYLHEEVPHGIAIMVESLNEREDGLVEIGVSITVEKENHKGIIIGKQGAMLKKIGSLARRDLEEMYEGQVNLEIWIRAREGWRDNEYFLRKLGFR